MAAFREMDDATLLAEFAQWDCKVKTATGWGAALMQAAQWRDACGRILAERGLMRDFEPCIRREPPAPQTKEGGRCGAKRDMTATPSLPAQIEAVRAAIARREQQTEDWSATESEIPKLMAVLVTLQQHERLEAVVKAARDLLRHAGIKHPGADNVIVSRERVHTLESALAALGTAASGRPEDAERGLKRDG